MKAEHARSDDGASSGAHAGERGWEQTLSAALGASVAVRRSRARREVIQSRRVRGGWELRLSARLGEPPGEVREAIAEWMRTRGRDAASRRVLDLWVDSRLRLDAARSPHELRLEPRGAHHDLAELADELARAEFAAEFGAQRELPAIGWGRAGRSRSRRSLRLGSFDPFSRAVRVHPVLDSGDAPRFFVRYILFHELLHAVLDAPLDGQGERRIHGPEFRSREKTYGDYRRALEWEKQHLVALIRCARAGRGFELGRRAKARMTPDATHAPRQHLLF